MPHRPAHRHAVCVAFPNHWSRPADRAAAAPRWPCPRYPHAGRRAGPASLAVPPVPSRWTHPRSHHAGRAAVPPCRSHPVVRAAAVRHVDRLAIPTRRPSRRSCPAGHAPGPVTLAVPPVPPRWLMLPLRPVVPARLSVPPPRAAPAAVPRRGTVGSARLADRPAPQAAHQARWMHQ